MMRIPVRLRQCTEPDIKASCIMQRKNDALTSRRVVDFAWIQVDRESLLYPAHNNVVLVAQIIS